MSCICSIVNVVNEIDIKAKLLLQDGNRSLTSVDLITEKYFCSMKFFVFAFFALFWNFSQAQTDWCNVGSCGTTHIGCNNNGVNLYLFI